MYALLTANYIKFLKIILIFHLFFRSFYLSLEIKKALRNQPNQNQAISLICPNGASYVIGQWAIWMSGNMMVPISPQITPDGLEYFIKDSKSVCVISANCILDKVCIHMCVLRLRAQSFISLKAFVCFQDKNGGFAFSRCLNGTFP